MSIRKMRLMCDRKWRDMCDAERSFIKGCERRQIGQFCKYGYTQHSLWLIDIGLLIYCEGYAEHCDIMHSR